MKNLILLVVVLASSTTFAADQKGKGCNEKVDALTNPAVKSPTAQPAKVADQKKESKPIPRAPAPAMTAQQATILLTKWTAAVGSYSQALGAQLRSLNIPLSAAMVVKSLDLQTFIAQETHVTGLIAQKIAAQPALKAVFINDGFESRLQTDISLLVKALKYGIVSPLRQAQDLRVQLRKISAAVKAVKLNGQAVGKLNTKQIESVVNGALSRSDMRLAVANISVLIRANQSNKPALAQALKISPDFKRLLGFLYPMSSEPVIVVDPSMWVDDPFIIPVFEDPTLDPSFEIPSDPITPVDPDPVIDPTQPDEPPVPPVDPTQPDDPPTPPAPPVVDPTQPDDPPTPPAPPVVEPTQPDDPPAPPVVEPTQPDDPPAPPPADDPAPSPAPAEDPAP